MSRKPFYLMSRQGQLKRIKKVIAHTAQTPANNSTDDNHSEENMTFSHQRMVRPIQENELHNIDPSTFPHSSLIQQNTLSNDSYSIFHNVFAEHPLSDSDHENQVDQVDTNDAFINNLRHWALKYQVAHVAINALLNILRDHNCFDLPADARSLLKTPENVITRVVEPGNYSHIGLEKNLRKIWEFVKENESEIHLLINIDGVPLFKSSSMEFWPILGLVYNVPSIKSIVFPIGVYCGTKKPTTCASFMEEFVSEVIHLISSGLVISGKNIKVAIKGFVCDTPAKSFLLGVKGHTGYYSCTKCKQPGVYLQNRMTFPECNATLRTHEEFLHMVDEDFQTTQTPLIAIPGIDFIKSFPLDYMHLVCLGVVRSLIYIWMFGPVPLKLPRQILNEISTDLVALAKHMPLEFNRKPRSLDDVKRWKATEFRQFLLYTGPLVLLKLQSEYASYYNNFLCLTVSMSILLNPEYCVEHNDYARNLLQHFVKTFIHMYGPQMATYNLHGLIHLSDDVFEFGALDSCSAFPFENFLQVFKKNVRKGDKPLQQVIKRFGEMSNTNFWATNMSRAGSTYPHFSKPHSSDLLLTGCDKLRQFKSIKFESFVITTTHPDSYCILKDGSVVEVCNVVFSKNTQSMIILCKEFAAKENFFDAPLIESSCIGIHIVKNKLNLCEKPVTDIVGKVVLLPFHDHHLAIKMLHS